MCRNFSIFKSPKCHSQPFQCILHVAKSIADPAQAIQYRRIIRHQLGSTLDIVACLLQPFCSVRQRVSQRIEASLRRVRCAVQLHSDLGINLAA